jgi:tetratricopeptide (TPR) repeat protein
MPELTLQQARDLAERHMRAGQVAEAESIWRQMLTYVPNDDATLVKLSQVRLQADAFDEAIQLMQRAAQLRPNDAGYQSNLGVIFSTIGRFGPAISYFESAIRLQPNLAEARNNLGNALRETERYAEAESQFRTALSLRPDYADAEWNLAFVLLARGDFATGLPAYEARLKMRGMPNRAFPQPMWDGSALAGRTILLHAEQGIGDTFNFIRYAPIVAASGGRVLALVQPTVHRLMQWQSLGVEQWLADGDALPAFDVHCPLLSLPKLFGTTMQTIPPQSPSLQVDPKLAATWKQKLADDTSKLKVGLVWAGNQFPPHNRKRSTALEALLPLANVPYASFYSLQKGAAPPSPATATAMRLIDFTLSLNDFADTAAMIDALDLVITIDTGVAHLAGAMGKPTWTLLPAVPDWRYFLDRADSPWYPSMRLFRQLNAGDWATPIAQVVAELRGLVGRANMSN